MTAGTTPPQPMKGAHKAIVALVALALLSVPASIFAMQRGQTPASPAEPVTVESTPSVSPMEAELSEWVIRHGATTLAFFDVAATGIEYIADGPTSTWDSACAEVWVGLEEIFDDLLEAADDAPVSVEGDFRAMTALFAEGLYHCIDGDTGLAIDRFEASNRAMDSFNETVSR